jgi:Icc-related predicted phosphoesterase
MTNLKIVAISDTHCAHAKVTIPECDVLVHAGDFSWVGRFGEVCDFLSWLKQQPARHKVFVCGNHELSCDKYHRKYDPSIRDLLVNTYDDSIHYLENKSITIDGVKFYGTPYTPWFHDWGFNGEESDTHPFSSSSLPKLRDVYGWIDDDTDVLICHGPAYGCADEGGNGNSDERLGSTDLLRRTQQLKKLKLTICGHIHEARGLVRLLPDGKLYANVSTLDRDYKTARPPVVIEVNETSAQILSGY